MSPDIVELTSSAIQNMTPDQGVQKKAVQNRQKSVIQRHTVHRNSAELCVCVCVLKQGSKMIYDDSTEKDTEVRE